MRGRRVGPPSIISCPSGTHLAGSSSKFTIAADKGGIGREALGVDNGGDGGAGGEDWIGVFGGEGDEAARDLVEELTPGSPELTKVRHSCR